MVTTRSMDYGEASASAQDHALEVDNKNGKHTLHRSSSHKTGSSQPALKRDPPSKDPPLPTYRANCHCKAFVYEIDIPEIHSVTECNCSICHKKGYLWVFPSEYNATLRVVIGNKAKLSRYTFGPGKMVHLFCPICATPLMMESMGGGGRAALNVRAIQGINIWALEKKAAHGNTVGAPYKPPAYRGPLPEISPTQQLYTGSCHCGALTIALASKPLDETFTARTAECNCSICERNAYRWLYPSNKQVILNAVDPSLLGRYSFGRHVLQKTFCRVCGVCMTNEYNELSEEERKALRALPVRGFANSMKMQRPVNLRVFPDVDLARMRAPTLNDEARIISPRYIDP